MKINRFPLLTAGLWFTMAFIFGCSLNEAGTEDKTLTDGGSEVSNGDGAVSCNGEKHYLGYGYDVINSGYINRRDVKIAHPILDQNKMCKAGIIATAPYSEQDFKIFTGSSIKEFYKERNFDINLSLGNEITSVFFSGKFSSEFSSSNATNENTTTYYSRVRSYRYTQDDYIKNATSQNLSEYLTESFFSDLENKTASEILNQYGTHIFIRYFKGGSLEANYTYSGSSLTSNAQVKAAVEASYKGVSGGVSGSNASGKDELEQNTSFKYYTYGGKALGATSMAQLKNEYGSWTESIAGNSDICGIGDFNQSFIAIWELAKAVGETAKATQLENEFKKRAADQGLAFPLMKLFKTVRKEYTTSGTQSLTGLIPATATIAEIEIYALGAGGGGQGGNYSGVFDREYGTGGAGGGGAASYAKLGGLGLNKGETVSINVSIGAGGAGGVPYTSTDTRSGSPGSNGGNTTVSWVAKSITIEAKGGEKGGTGGGTENSKLVPGGNGGATSSRPTSIYIRDWDSKSGSKGEDGNFDKDGFRNKGGTSATITGKGTFSPFGGYNGASSTQNAEKGGGGNGGYYQSSGTTSGKSGGNGLVVVVVHYYTEE